MLELKGISKVYKTGALVQTALDGVSINLRDNEFVAVLGPSGSGKTTLLNIIGGLDRYDDGELRINGTSTKAYRERDWDTYRNHTIGFVFQSYNLIPHQTVLSNVELALTISGVSRKERKRRALDALEAVGLKEQAHKRPNQLSGGQMQRVAIARALVNDPDILLADEPTGALDSKTSVQVMELLKVVARDRLVIMVTHNPELAEQYATRIVNLKDGEIISDTDPYVPEGNIKNEAPSRVRKARMSFFTALSLSLNNLLTKKGRTFLTSFAGSIGIIGIALILSLSQGFQNYIDKIQEDTLSSYPLTITSETVDATSAILSMVADRNERPSDDGSNVVHERQYMTTMFSSIGTNDLKSFREHLQDTEDEYGEYVSGIEYIYSVQPLIYTEDAAGNIARLNPSRAMSGMMRSGGSSLLPTGGGIFNRIDNDTSAYEEDYDVLAGRWPQKYDELIIVLSERNSISDLLVYSLGLRDTSELRTILQNVLAGEEAGVDTTPMDLTYDELMDIELKLVRPSDLYRFNSRYNIYEDMTSDEAYMREMYRDSQELHIVGIVCLKDGKNSFSLSTGVGYRSDLIDHVINDSLDTDIVRKQMSDPDTDVFSGKRFDDENQERPELDFNEMITVDEDMLKDAFKINISKDDIKIDTLSETEIQKIVMDSSKKAADSINSGPDKTMLTALFGSVNSAYLNEMTILYDSQNLVDVPTTDEVPSSKETDEIPSGDETAPETLPDTPEGGTPADADAGDTAQEGDAPVPQVPSVSLLSVTDDKVDATGKTITGSTYRQFAKTLLSSDPHMSQLAGMMDMVSDSQFSALAKGVESMFRSYYSKIMALGTFDTAGGTVSYMKDPSSGLVMYGGSLSNYALIQEEVTGNSEALESTSGVINDIVENYMVYMIAAQIGDATGKIVDPMVRSLSDLGNIFNEDIMSIDTDRFQEAFQFDMDEDELSRLMETMMSGTEEKTYRGNLVGLGYQDFDDPTSISIYFRDFESKEHFLDYLDRYNDSVDDERRISYTDITGILMSSVKTIVDVVTYVLIAFVSISLIVSSIMIAVITLISVMERTKEIGILRAIGASKRNVSSIFNAETFIIGLLSGLLGVGVTFLLLQPINLLIHRLSGITDINAVLPWRGAVILVIISVVLTIFAGIIPSRKAAKQDPVVALRTE